MKKEQFPDFKLFLKTFWIWTVLIALINWVVTLGNYRLKLGFDWSFLQKPESYLSLLFYILFWFAFEYFLFWKTNPNFREKIKQKRCKSN